MGIVVQPTFLDMQGAADFLGPGALYKPEYQPEIVDMVRRRGPFGQRIAAVPATGQPSRYFEQTRIVTGAFVDPRSPSYSAGADPTRRERSITIKAIVGSIGFGLFDVEVTRQQGGSFSGLVAKDLNDTVEGCMLTSDIALWQGTDTSLTTPTTQQYMGGLNQINRTASVASTASIIDAIKAEVASLMAHTQFKVMPTACYANPILLDLIDQEERLNHRQMPRTVLNDVTGGLTVNAIATQAGLLPLIPDWTIPNGVSGGSSSESGKTDYTLVILSEKMVERHYVTTPEPRVFVLGLEGNLATRYQIVLFDAVVFKGKADATTPQNVAEGSTTTYCHSKMTITR